MVEGHARSAFLLNQLQHRLRILKHILSQDPQCPDPLFLQPRVTPNVTSRIVAHVMRLPVNLDTQPGCGTIEIEHVGPCRMLTTEAKSTWTRTQHLPQQHLRQGHRPPQGSRIVHP
jgi:hypothetical protein